MTPFSASSELSVRVVGALLDDDLAAVRRRAVIVARRRRRRTHRVLTRT
jgi:hypothetical protein